MFKIKNQSNYLCKIHKINKLIPIEGANTIQQAIIDFNSVIVGKSTSIGDVVVYFPLESQINSELLSYLNLYRDGTLNRNQEIKGFFEKNGRVRAVSMMKGKVKSEGFTIPLEDFSMFLADKGNYSWSGYTDDYDGMEFDYFDDLQIAQKYAVSKVKLENFSTKDKTRYNKMVELLDEKYFKFYTDTKHLKQNLHLFELDDNVVITRKLHGSSAIFSHTIINKKLKWYEKLLKKLNVKIPDWEYGYVISSGKPKSGVPKNILSDSIVWKTPNNSYYTEDIWSREFDKIKTIIPKGYTLYGEIVGPGIQGNYTYGHDETHFYCYKITVTNSDGLVHTFDWESLKKFCTDNGISHVPELHTGPLFQVVDTLPNESDEENLITSLSTKYLEKITPCGNPDEGICIQKNSDKVWYKFKSFNFLKKETEMLDKGEEISE